MLRVNASLLSLLRKRNLSSVARHLAPLDIETHDPELSELLFPAAEASPSTAPHRFPTPAEDAFLYDASEASAYQRQLLLEEQTVQTAVERYTRLAESAMSRGDIWSHRPAAALVGTWFGPVSLAIRKAQEAAPLKRGGRQSIQREGDNFLRMLPPDVLAVITIQETFGALMRETDGVKVSSLAMNVANAVRGEINAEKLRQLGLKQRAMERASALAAETEDEPLESTGGASPSPKEKRTPKMPSNKALYRALKSSTNVASAVNFAAMSSGIEGSSWSARNSVLVGSRLIEILLHSAFVQDPNTMQITPAFRHFRRYVKKNYIAGMVQFDDMVLKLIGDFGIDASLFLDPKHQPMEVPPRPWISPKNGGYLKTRVDLIRARHSDAFKDALAVAEMQPLYDGLNALGETAWRVNGGVLDAGLTLWARGGGVAGLVTKEDQHVPAKSEFLAQARADHVKSVEETSTDEPPDFDEAAALRRLRSARKATRKANRELFSQRADTQYRLDHAASFGDKERFFLPHNVDFRGRAYPIPVYLQHMGADLTRAILTFSGPGVRLGERGVYWLKVHLANLLGADKLSFDERVAVADDAMARAVEVARSPLTDSNLEWWSTHEDPFQLLAACQEISAAVGRYGGEQALENFHSTLPISMDGSCNGLQHYAALGRDVLGGEQVNLVKSDRPQDVYTGVANLVAERIDAEAASGNEVARLLQGKVSRKIVKQTVMTSVYGVTITGARDQIGNRLKDINFPPDKVFEASLMLAKMTLSSLGDIFAGATNTMDWLSDCAQRIARDGHEVEWVTPVGLPVMQPYRRKAVSIVKTILQRVSLEQHGDHLAVSTARQRSAFPPNYVHSIDSSHMLFTAVECQKKGLNFAAVHDSFWTNAGTVDTMNGVLREEFVKLHERELLTELRDGFRMRFPCVKFGEVPARGSLGLKEVLESPYFFS